MVPKAMKYRVQFIRPSYQRFYQQHREQILAAFDRCARNGDFMLQEETRVFEHRLAQYVGTKNAVTVNSGTDAMFLSLVALGIGPGDEVITVSHTFIATIQAIVHTGATPILVDVRNDELMDAGAALDAVTDKTKAIVPVHFHGKVCSMEALLGPQVPVVEDAAQAIGASRYNHRAGSMGAVGCFSFNFPKILGAYGDAGAVTTDDDKLARRLLLLRNHWNITQGSVDSDRYPQPSTMGWGYKSRMDNIQAAILNVKLDFLPALLARRKAISEFYENELRNHAALELPTHQAEEVVQEYVIRVNDNQRFRRAMDAAKIEVLVRDTKPNHLLPGLKLDHYKLPVTELLAKECARLPIYPEMTDVEVEAVAQAVRAYAKKS